MRFFFSLLFLFATAVSLQGETMIFDASVPSTPGTKGETFGAATQHKNNLLTFTNTVKREWPGIHLSGKWSIGPNEVLVIELVNQSPIDAIVGCRLDSSGADPGKGKRTFEQKITLSVGEKKRWEILPNRTRPLSSQLQDKLGGMNGLPGGIRLDPWKADLEPFDPSDLAGVFIFYPQPTETYSVGVRRVFIGPTITGTKVVSNNTALELPPEQFFPMVDRYGQYIHADWPGKVKFDDDLKRNRETEEKELAAAPKWNDRNQYGGWTKGPKLKATGHFYPMKRNGVWWLVDPEGCLFWSHGVVHVHSSDATGVTDREHLFTELPFESCKWKTNYCSGGFYVGKTPYLAYSFSRSNRILKYGDDWKFPFAETAHRRLHAWGMNTVAAWSDSAVCTLRKTPYTAALNSFYLPPIVGNKRTTWGGNVPDPFHPEFRKSFIEAMKSQNEAIHDPWCIGFFVNNELGWANDRSLAVGALASPPDQPAKIAVVDMLRKKYETIRKFNTAWSTSYADWDALLAATDVPNTKNETVVADLRQGYVLIAEEYFKVIRDELKRIAPEKLYLGCRFAPSIGNDLVIRAAEKFCDVISFNIYENNLNDFKLPKDVDKAVLIGEFHFGALDRGMLHPGLCAVANQRERGAAYVKYVQSALKHPNIVGTHWFQYGDQPTTGWGHAPENYQCGLVDVCDTPYPETIKAVKQIGNTMYDLRAKRRK